MHGYQAWNYEEARQQLARALFAVGAVLTRESDHPLVVMRDGPSGQERGFRLKLHERTPDAPLSPVYLNLRTPDNPRPGPLTPEVVELAAHCLHQLAFRHELSCNAVAGIPNAGTPFAKVFAQLPFTLPLLQLDKEEVGGKRRVVPKKNLGQAEVRQGSTVLVIDDLVTEADSKFEAIEAIEGAGYGYRVADVLVLVDRQQGGSHQLLKHGQELHAVFTISELLEMAIRIECISSQLGRDIARYLWLTSQ